MQKPIMIILALLLAGRAMTLAFIHRAGRGELGDPPAAWLMPLIGDAVVGLGGFVIAYLVWKKQGLWVWATVLAWNVIGIWDALSAFIVHLTNPWPEFFMLQLVGPSMFFAASAMHLVFIYLICKPRAREHFLGY